MSGTLLVVFQLNLGFSAIVVSKQIILADYGVEESLSWCWLLHFHGGLFGVGICACFLAFIVSIHIGISIRTTT